MKATLIFVCLALMLSACGGDPNEVGPFKPYINTALGFRVDYPSNWQAVDDPDTLAMILGGHPETWSAVMFLRDQAAGVLFGVLVQQLNGDQPLDAFGAEQIAEIRSSAGEATYSDPVPLQLGNLDALETTTRVEQNGQALTQRAVLAVRGNRGYIVLLMGPADSPLLETLDEMLKTFAILP